MSARGIAFSKAGKVQLVPRGKWQLCHYLEQDDGTLLVLIEARLYTVTPDKVRPKEELH